MILSPHGLAYRFVYLSVYNRNKDARVIARDIAAPKRIRIIKSVAAVVRNLGVAVTPENPGFRFRKYACGGYVGYDPNGKLEITPCHRWWTCPWCRYAKISELTRWHHHLSDANWVTVQMVDSPIYTKTLSGNNRLYRDYTPQGVIGFRAAFPVIYDKKLMLRELRVDYTCDERRPRLVKYNDETLRRIRLTDDNREQVMTGIIKQLEYPVELTYIQNTKFVDYISMMKIKRFSYVGRKVIEETAREQWLSLLGRYAPQETDMADETGYSWRLVS